jgi:hypothetical protein
LAGEREEMTAAVLVERDGAPASRQDGSGVSPSLSPRAASTALPPTGYARLLLAWSAELERRPVTFGEFMDTRKELK